jgi:acetolactate synthase I/II/III large subunit
MSPTDGERGLSKPERRRFLTAAAAMGATSLMQPASASPAPGADKPSAQLPSAVPPLSRVAAAEVGAVQQGLVATDAIASDFMADVIKSLNIEYVAINPASSFRGLHESLINYGQNK